MADEFAIGARRFSVSALPRGDGFVLEIGGERVPAELRALGAGRFELYSGGRPRPMWLAVRGDRVFVHAAGRHFEVERIDPLERIRAETRAAKGGAALCAPMPGVVVEIRTAPGEIVRAGDVVLVIESMKLQTPIVAEADGRVAEIAFSVGQSFQQGAVLARIERQAGPPEGNE